MGATIPMEFYEDSRFSKINASLTKTLQYNNHNILAGLHFLTKNYELNDRWSRNFLGNVSQNNGFHNFDRENVYSILFQDDYKFSENLTLLANAKIDNYQRDGYLKETTEKLFRVGAIYTPFENIGFKGFYTQTYLPVSFYNIDFVNKNNPNLKSQQYELYTAEIAYTRGNSKLNLNYNHVKIDDFIYFSPIGFVNIKKPIKTEGLALNLTHNLTQSNKLHVNYFVSKQSEGSSNYQNGGYIKFMGKRGKIDYFTSLIFRNSFSYYNVHVKDSFDLSLGATYNFSKDLSLSIKGENLLEKSTSSIYTVGFPGTPFALENKTERSVSLWLRWMF